MEYSDSQTYACRLFAGVDVFCCDGQCSLLNNYSNESINLAQHIKITNFFLNLSFSSLSRDIHFEQMRNLKILYLVELLALS